MVEHLHGKEGVSGSSPDRGSILFMKETISKQDQLAADLYRNRANSLCRTAGKLVGLGVVLQIGAGITGNPILGIVGGASEVWALGYLNQADMDIRDSKILNGKSTVPTPDYIPDNLVSSDLTHRGA